MSPENTPAASPARCPHCQKPLDAVGWLHNREAGLLTFYHNDPACMTALNCQLVPVEQSRIALPSELRPRGLG